MAKELNKNDVNEIYRILTERIVDDDEEDETPETVEDANTDGNKLSPGPLPENENMEEQVLPIPSEHLSEKVFETEKEDFFSLNDMKYEKNLQDLSGEEEQENHTEDGGAEKQVDNEDKPCAEEISPLVESTIADIEEKLGEIDLADDMDEGASLKDSETLVAEVAEEEHGEAEELTGPAVDMQQKSTDLTTPPAAAINVEKLPFENERDNEGLPEREIISESNPQAVEKENETAANDNMKGEIKMMESKKTWKIVFKEQFVDVSCDDVNLSLMRNGKNQVKLGGMTFVMDGEVFFINLAEGEHP
jgi:hypothetical protein